jgi:hypothetical protein
MMSSDSETPTDDLFAEFLLWRESTARVCPACRREFTPAIPTQRACHECLEKHVRPVPTPIMRLTVVTAPCPSGFRADMAPDTPAMYLRGGVRFGATAEQAFSARCDALRSRFAGVVFEFTHEKQES